MSQETYLQLAIREFKRTKALGDGALSQINDEQFFAVPSEGDNSIAVIVKHVGGNLLSRWADFLSSDGEKPGRNRDAEFEVTVADTRQSLIKQWEAGWTALFSALKPLDDLDLKRTVTIRGEAHSVLQAINRQLTHYSYHVGQVVYVARHYAGNSWRTLSVARGKSVQFNAEPTKYIGGA
jgi:Protein of unknown function (DUF1572)